MAKSQISTHTISGLYQNDLSKYRDAIYLFHIETSKGIQHKVIARIYYESGLQLISINECKHIMLPSTHKLEHKKNQKLSLLTTSCSLSFLSSSTKFSWESYWPEWQKHLFRNCSIFSPQFSLNTSQKSFNHHSMDSPLK